MNNDKVREALSEFDLNVIKSANAFLKRNGPDTTRNLYVASLMDIIDNLLKDPWQPIETAPKDGSRIIVYRPYGSGNYIPKVGIDYWSKEYGDVWAKSNSHSQPTHWQPLPNPPERI